MALADASRAFRASTLCAGAVPANSRNSPTRMQDLRAIVCSHSQKINIRTKDLDFTFDIPNGHTYTPEVPPTEPNCFSSMNYRVWLAGCMANSNEHAPFPSGLENFWKETLAQTGSCLSGSGWLPFFGYDRQLSY